MQNITLERPHNEILYRGCDFRYPPPSCPPEPHFNETTTTAKHNPKRQSTQAGGSAVFTGRQADRQTEPECQRSLPSPPAPCVFVCSSSSGGGGGARCWSSPTTRSVGRSAVAERAPNARIIHSTGGAVRVAHDSRRCAEVWLFAFEATPLAAFASLDSVAVITQQCRVKIHVSFPSQAATSTSS